MGLKGASFNRLRSRVDKTLRDFFPVRLIIAGRPVDAACPGGKTMTEYVTGGESSNFRFPMRVPVSAVLSMPEVGDAIEWIQADHSTVKLEVMEVSHRPHEDVFAIACKHRRS